MKSHLSSLRAAFRLLATSLAFVAMLFAAAKAPAANTVVTLTNTSSTASLLTANNWSPNSAPTAANDAVLNVSGGTGIRTMTAGSLTVGSLNLITNAGTYSIRNETSGATDSILTLAGGTGNSVPGSLVSDLLFVTNGATLNVLGTNGNPGAGGTGRLLITLATNGNFDVGTSASSTISANISGVNYSITNIGGGSLTLSGTNVLAGINVFSNKLTISGGVTTVRQLLATNVIFLGLTNSTLSLSGGALVTSNAANAIAANIIMSSNSSLTINSSWTMNGGTNFIVPVTTNAGAGTITIGGGVNNVVVMVNSNAVFSTQNPWNTNASSATNMAVTVGGLNGGGGAQLIITNGGRVIARAQPGNGAVGMNVGATGSSANRVIIAGADGLGNKSILDLAGINTAGNGNRLSIGGSVATTSNNWVMVGSGGVLTNFMLYCYNGWTNGLIITNGGQAYPLGVVVGRTGTGNFINVAGADSAGNRSLLAGVQNYNLYIGGSGGGLGNQSTYSSVNIGQNGWVTNINAVIVGPDTNSLFNSLNIANGGQLFSLTASMIGAYSNANNNSVSIGGSFGTTNAMWTMNGQALTIGGTNWSTNNSVTLNTGGLLTNVSTIRMGGAGTLLNFNGGTLAVSASGMLISTNAGTVSATNYVQAGGAVIDTGIFTVTNGLPMTADPNSGGGGLIKLGVGTLVLTNVNTYAGNTIVRSGRLLVTTAASISGSAVTVLSGASSTVLVTAADGQWTCAGLTNSDNSLLTIDFGVVTASLTTAPLQVTGNFDLNKASITLVSSKAVAAGTYPLIKYGTQSGTLTPASISLPPGMVATLSNDTDHAVIDLVVTTASPPMAYWAVGNGNWDTATTNWKDIAPPGAANLVYQDGYPVVFDDSASGTGNISVVNTAPVSPLSVVVNGAVNSYTISGSAITGSATLAKNGSSTLTLNGANTYAGNTTVNGGNLAVAAGGAIYSPTATLNIGPGATLATNTLAAGGAITVQTLLATNVYMNGTNSTLNLNGGTLITSNAATGIAANINVANNANFFINSSWAMNGGSNLIANVNTNANSTANVYIGSGTNNVQVTVNTNAVLAFANFGSATNPPTFVIGNSGTTNNTFTVNGGVARNAKAINLGNSATSVSNQLAVLNGGQFVLGTNIGTSTVNGNYNSILVGGANSAGVKSLLDFGGSGDRRVTVGPGTTNLIWVGSGGVMSNASFQMQGPGGNGNAVIVTNGGQVYLSANICLGRIAGQANTVIVGGTDAGGGNSLINSIAGVGQILIGCSGTAAAMGTNNWVRVDQGGVINVPNIFVGGANGPETNSLNNALIITNGGQVTVAGSTTIGMATNTLGNWIYVGGSFGATNSTLNQSVSTLTIGASTTTQKATNNFVMLDAGGMLTNVSSVILGGANSALIFNGGTLAAGTNFNLTATNASTIGATNYVQAGGAVIDSGTFTVTNVVPLVQDPGSIGGGLTKLGVGTLVLSGSNTYTGPTLVSAGTLAGLSGGSSASSVVTVLAGATNSALVKVPNGQWTCAAVSANDGSTLDFFFGVAPGTNAAPLNVTNALGAFAMTNVYVTVRSISPLLAGQYPLVKYLSFTGDPTLATLSLPVGVVGYLYNNVANSSIDLVITTGFTGVVWGGYVNGVWDDAVNKNWLGSTVTNFNTNDAVVFDDSLSGNSTVSSSFTVLPASVSFFNSLTNYIISASIDGTNALNKYGAASVTLSGSNSFSGGVTLNAGTLALASTNALGTGLFTINGGTLDNLAGAVISNVNNNAQVWNKGFTFAGSAGLNLGTGAVIITTNINITGPASVLVVGGNISGTGGLSHSGNSSLTLSGILSFSGGVTNTGGWLTNTGLNTYSGMTSLTGGTNAFNSLANVGQPSALGKPLTSADGVIAVNSTIRYLLGSLDSTSDRVFNWQGGTFFNDSVSGKLILTGGFTNSNNGSLTFRGSGTNVLSGLISLGSGAVTRTDGGLTVLTNQLNLFSGNLSASDGYFYIDTIANSGVPCSIGTGNGFTLGQGSGNTVGKLQLAVTNGSSCNRAITIIGGTGTGASGGTMESTIAGRTVTFSGNVTTIVTNFATGPTLTLTGAGNGVLTGVLGINTNSLNAMAIVKSGAGSWTISGLNTNRGTVTVSAGTLLINGNSAGATNTVAVSSGATFGGNGTNGGSVTLSAGGILVPGGLDAVGKLALTNSLTLNGNKLFFKLGNNTGTNDQVAVGQALSVTGVNTIYISGASPIGTNTLVTFGSISGAGSFVLGAAYPNALLITNGNSIQLAVTGAFSGSTLTWKGNLSGTWDSGALNWTNGFVATSFNLGDHVTFDDTLVANSLVGSAGVVSPNSVTFLNSLTNYTISASIGGTGPLTKSGTASVTLTGANTYTGITTVNAGSLVVTNGGAIYSPNATMNIAPASTSATATLAGGGAITVQTLISTNVVLGGSANSVLNLSGGTLTTSNAPTGVAANILVASNATYSINSSWNMNGGTNTVSSVNTSTTAGTLVVGLSTNSVVVTVNSNATFADYNPSGTPANISFMVGSGGTSSFNLLIITNGGQATLRNGSGSVNLTIGNTVGNNGNGIIVAGTDGNGKKSLLNLGNDRLYIGNGSSYGSTNNFVLVDGGIITNASMFSWAVNSTFVITNGGLAAGTTAYVGRSGLSNLWTVAGADTSGKRATLLLTSGTGILIGGAQITAATPGTNNVLWVGQNGLVTNSTAAKIYVGSDTNSFGNGLVIANGGQVFSGAASQIGSTNNANNNYVTIGGTFGTTNSLWNLGNTSLTIGNNASASNNFATLFAGGILTNVSTVILGGANSALNFNGGQLSASASGILIATNATTANATNFVQAGGAIIDTVTFNVTNVLPLTEDPSSTGGGLTKLGAGALVLPIANTYSGSTLVSAGTLLVNNADGSATGAGTVTVNSGATLGGSGTIAGQLILSSGALVTNVVGSPLTIGGAITLNGNTVKVISTAALGSGDYVLIANTSGGITGSAASAVTVGGVGLAANTTASIVTTANSVLLRVVANTTLQLGSSLNPSLIGTPVSFTATVQTNGVTAAAAPGNIVFKVAGTPVATNAVVSGAAAYATSTLGGTLGVQITAEYSGADYYQPATNSLTQVVNQAITATSGANGSVTPAGVTVVSYGGSQTYTITPDSGYLILDVLVDGSSVGAVGSYPFTGVTANHTISASFALACTSPVIIGGIDPGSATVVVGGTATFALTNVTGTSPLYYQWRSNSVAIAGATGASYTTPALTMLANGGSYDCVVTNDCGTATAGAVSLTVTQAVPAITILSSAQTNGYHDSVVFTATNLPSGATSNVVFTANGVTFSTNDLVAGGAISLAITNLPRGDTNIITATYSGDTNYVSVSASLTQTVTNHVPTANVLTVVRTAGLNYNFRWSEIATNWNDADGDALSHSVADLVSTNGVTVANNGTLLLYPATAANVNDRFYYTINDLYGGTNTGYVDVVVDPFVGVGVTGQQTTNSIGGGPTFTVTYYGIPSYTYKLQRSTNLFAGLLWVNIATNTIGGSCKTNVVDDFGDLGVVPAEAFYRVQWKP